VKSKRDSHAVAASYRNPSFLVVPQCVAPIEITRSPSRSLSPDPKERRSFEYFQTRTLPMWTEFFDSDLWSRTVLQLIHDQPAIKHGILALSIMHERYESVVSISTSDSQDFAFTQYMLAVKYSNELLKAYQKGDASLEMVLIACVIFTSYENLAGNYKIAGMHLRNGLRILATESQEDQRRSEIANSLYRFDLEAMTFSDNASRYDFELDLPPACPQVQDRYTRNDVARDDLVGIIRCMMWIGGVAEGNPDAPQHAEWLRIVRESSNAIKQWEVVFAEYQRNMTAQDLAKPRLYAGNTLLKMGAITIRIMMGAEAGIKSEMAWDPFLDDFKTIVDLAETIPVLRPSPTKSSAGQGHRPLRPRPSSASPMHTPTARAPSTSVFSQISTSPPSPLQQQQPSHFSPSFELSPIVPLFIVACRCRDPLTRRRAIVLLLSYRRREGVWDSYGAGMVSLQCMLKEENIEVDQTLDFENQAVHMRGKANSCQDIPEAARVRDILVEVKVVEGKIDLVYSMTTGEECKAQQLLYESRGSGVPLRNPNRNGQLWNHALGV
jgi:hypothetical protein